MKNKSGKYIIIAAAAASVVCSAVRVFQLISLTDLNTGYFLKGAEFGGLLVYILLAVFAAALTALVITGRKKGDAAYFLSSGGMGDNATRALGISEALGAILIGLRITEGDALLITVFSGLAAALMLISGFALMGRVVPPAFTGHVKLPVAVYLFFRTANFFNSDLIVLNHAENLIVLLGYIVSTAFIASLARFYARIETKNTRITEVILALFTFLLCSTHTFSDLAGLLCGEGVAGFVSLNPDIAAMTLVSGTYLVVLFCTEKKKDLIPVAEA